MLQRAAEGGDAGAALTLAGTYDPLVLEKLGVQRPSAADVVKARAWYERAEEFALPKRLDAWKSWRAAITKTVTVALVAPDRLPNYQPTGNVRVSHSELYKRV
jgi:hypothetical protein